jgi:protein-disulfide isomerase
MRGRGWGSFLTLTLTAFLFAPPSATPQESNQELMREIKALKEALREIQKDLEEIKTLLQRRQAPPAPERVTLNLDESPFKGERAAKLTLVEFSDYQ